MSEGEPKPVSGRFKIPTYYGLVEIYIGEGRVYSGGDLLDQYFLVDPLKSIQSPADRLREISISTLRPADIESAQRRIRRERGHRNKPVFQLVPPEIPLTQPVTFVGNLLAHEFSKNPNGLYRGLADADDKTLLGIKKIGPTTIEIAQIFRDLARERLNLLI